MVARLMTNLSIGLRDWALAAGWSWRPTVRTESAKRPTAGVRAAKSSATAKNPIVKSRFIVLMQRRTRYGFR
jgi:hypothetical protein